MVAERLGFDREEALTLGRAVAGLNAYSKGVLLGLYEPSPEAEHDRRKEAQAGQSLHVRLRLRSVPVVQTPDGVRALSKDKPDSPASVERYLQSKFGDRLGDARQAMERLAASDDPGELATRAYALYDRFRPGIPDCVQGWGAAGELGLDLIEQLARK